MKPGFPSLFTILALLAGITAWSPPALACEAGQALPPGGTAPGDCVTEGRPVGSPTTSGDHTGLRRLQATRPTLLRAFLLAIGLGANKPGWPYNLVDIIGEDAESPPDLGPDNSFEPTDAFADALRIFCQNCAPQGPAG